MFNKFVLNNLSELLRARSKDECWIVYVRVLLRIYIEVEFYMRVRMRIWPYFISAIIWRILPSVCLAVFHALFITCNPVHFSICSDSMEISARYVAHELCVLVA